MASLYKRATPSQIRIMRAVAGAVKNVADCHPEWEFRPHFARSIAKRAAGTLTAQWPEVLAARSALSVKDVASLTGRAHPHRAQATKRDEKRPTRPAYRRSPLISVWREIARQLGDVKKSGNVERANALIDVLKLIAAHQKKE